VACNKFLAKLASDLQKPDGLVIVEPDRVREVLDPLPVSSLWGVGNKSEKRLRAMGLQTIGQVAALPEQVLIDYFGAIGSHFWRLAHGIDRRAVVPDGEAKSISTETTFANDLGDRQVLRAWLLGLVEQLGQRLRQAGVRARTIDLNVRSADFRTYHRSATLSDPTNVTVMIWQAASELFDRRVETSWLPVRLLGGHPRTLTKRA
jgi:DNA polymerase-4